MVLYNGFITIGENVSKAAIAFTTATTDLALPHFASMPGIRHQWKGSFRLVSWNVNADAPLPRSRMSALLEVIKTTGAAKVIFLQEVSKKALTELLEDPWIQRNWYTSNVDHSAFRIQKFISVTLVSRGWVATHGILLGALWRISLPSRFIRDALCCDMIFNSSTNNTSGRGSTRIRLINVHLDSLPINPSLRPYQLSICSSYLSTAGRGIVAGDFSPVLPEDDDLVRTYDLTDAWTCLHPNDAGHTWGVYGEHVFPPNRFDKVALFNLTPSAMHILQTSEVEIYGEKMSVGGIELIEKVHFSDRFGVSCEVRWDEDRAQSE
ncbi:Endonuclease/exonuclease/phosphatase [Bipolaris maydis]|nr:Endonuclease/exonuclease/phosphatase [Bipolaris maydis]KAJ6274632.1 Endonuclease/exonuclease/phosphatase [Bipolaris maydis]